MDSQEEVRRQEIETKPEGLTNPGWYFSWHRDNEWRVFADVLYGRQVFNVYTPWFSFGYAW